MTTETLDKLYLEWSQFTRARTSREIKQTDALTRIASSNPNHFETPEDHANYCVQCARDGLGGSQ
jgi:hypothetical protein